MDDKLLKAFEIANFMTTLANQKKVLHEEFQQNCVYFFNGATFKVSRELINFTKTVLDLDYTHDVPFVDINGFPVVITDVQEFFDKILLTYMESLNEYSIKFANEGEIWEEKTPFW